MKRFVIAAASLMPAALAGITELGKVNVLTDSNIADFIAENEAGALIEFYAPWCGHCKKLEPEYDKAAASLNDDGVKIPLAKVDATVEKKSGEKYGVRGYPTIKWFVGGEAAEYDGPREAKGIAAWIKSMTGPAVVESEPKEDDTFSVTYYGAELEGSTFETVAKKNRKTASWYFVKSDDEKVVLKHLKEDAIETTDFTEKFVTDNKFPLYGQIDGNTFGLYTARGNGLIWILSKMTASDIKEKAEESRPWATELAKELGSKYSVAWTNTHEFKGALDSMFGVKEFPAVVVQQKAGDKKKFVYDGEMTAEAVLQYVKDIESGKIVAVLKSEDVPEWNDEDPVKVIVGKTIEEKVFTEDKDVLFEVYAPWCGHCKKLDPEYLKVGKKVVKEGLTDILTIAKMDGTANDSPVDSLSWSGFPTIYYVKAGNKTPTSYSGPRDGKGIWKWLKDNHSKKDVFKERVAANKAEKGEKEAKEEL